MVRFFSSSEFLSIPSRLRKDCPAAMKCHKEYNNLLKYRQGKTMQKRIKKLPGHKEAKMQHISDFLLSFYLCLLIFPKYWFSQLLMLPFTGFPFTDLPFFGFSFYFLSDVLVFPSYHYILKELWRK